VLNAQGSYYAIERFINGLESTKRVTLVTAVDVKAAGSAAEGSTLNPGHPDHWG